MRRDTLSVRRWVALVPLSAIALIVLGFGVDRCASHASILRGVWVEDVALSGLERTAAERAIAQLDERLRKTPASVRVGGELFQLDPASIGFRLDVEETLALALAEGRAGNPFGQLGWWLARWTAPARVKPAALLDEPQLEQLLSRWEAKALPDRPSRGGVVLESGRIVADPPRRGRLVDRTRASRALLDVLVRERRPTLELPLVEVKPEIEPKLLEEAAARGQKLVRAHVELHLEEIDPADQDPPRTLRFEAGDLARALTGRITEDSPPRVELGFDPVILEQRLGPLRAALEKPPRNADIVVDARDRVSIVPSSAGTIVDAKLIAAALLEAASSRERAGPLPIVRGAPPERTTDELIALSIRGLVTQFTTHHACCQPRVHNIHRIADLVNGTIVKPGEIISLNALVGPRTKKNGFVPAPSIEDGEMVDALGGGVSQFATTFFNAVFHGGYDIIERQPHTYWFSRYPMGHEATLSWPKPDIIFRNDTSSGLYIQTRYSDTSITVKLFGDNAGRKVVAKVSDRQEITKPPVELIANESVSPDDEKVKESGQVGWSVIVSRIMTLADGTKKEERRKVTYKPRVRRVEVHPCRIPAGEPGHTGKPCPVPESDGGADAS